ncbi:MAG: hypothetical protein ACI9S8_000111 [Chlamydiales bacterium]|jgi:hypothetical protein
MGLGLAIKCFFKAFKDSEAARRFVSGETEKISKKNDAKEKGDYSHLRLLYLLQNSGRFIDFLKEDISPFSDVQVGTVVRKIHEECSKSLEDYITIRPVFEGQEGSSVTIPSGYDPSEIKIVGNVTGNTPLKGILRHKGWKAHKLSLPQQLGESKQEVLAPAEVEVQ